MNHTLERVASAHFLNEEKLIKFARQPSNVDRFSLAPSGDHLTVSTWYVDDLVEAFKTSMPASELAEDRLKAIQALNAISFAS